MPTAQHPQEPNLHGLTASQFNLLKETALAAKTQAYCGCAPAPPQCAANSGLAGPYSSFRVGASVLVAGPAARCVGGANVENASFPVGLCAERAALARAVTDGHREFVALAVAADGRAPVSPCGMCRQFVSEFCAADVPVFMFDAAGGWAVLTVGELLPGAFGPEQMGRGEGRGAGV